MCVIAYMKPFDRLANSDIELMFDANPDGAGLCYPDGGRVIIRKGFFTASDLLEAYSSVPANVPLIVHCRIATSGGIDEKTCHPFAVGRNLKKINRRSCNIAFAHNGILSGLGSKHASDTQEYIARVVSPLMHKSGYTRLCDMGYILRIIEATSQDCRFAFMDATGDVRLIGDWHEYKCAQVSNLAFKTFSGWGAGKYITKATSKAGRLFFDACDYCADSEFCAAYGPCCSTAREAEMACVDSYIDEYPTAIVGSDN